MQSSILWVIDVDGTLADNSHRSYLLQPPAPDWDRYFDYNLVLEDKPLAKAEWFFLEGRFKYGDHLILTARPERARTATEDWLLKYNFITESTRVLMKPDIIRLQRSSVFKHSALEVLAVENPDRKIILIDDHRDVLKVLEGSKFETRAAPECWDDSRCWPE